MKQIYRKGWIDSLSYLQPIIFLMGVLIGVFSFTAATAQTVSSGKLLVEIESKPLKTGWKKGSSGSRTWYEATINNYGNPGTGGVLSWSVTFNQTGVYRVNFLSMINGPNSHENNDAWLKFPNTSDIVYFGYKGNGTTESAIANDQSNNKNVVYPKGSSRGGIPGTIPAGGGPDWKGWFKAFMNKEGGWFWESKTSDFDGHNLFVRVLKTGTYTMQVENRSAGHRIDKLGIWKVDTYGVDGGSITGGSGGGGGGGGGTTCSASLGSLPTLDEDDAPITLSGGAPSGGSYSGPSVSNGKFDPSIGEGTYTITYTVTVDGCTASASRNITVTGSGGGGGTSPPPPSGSGDATFYLVNTNTNNDISTLANNGEINLANVGTNIGIRAGFNGTITTAVKFTLTGPYSHSQSEGISSPYSLHGDIGDDVNPWPAANLKTGNYTLSVKANGATTTISFSITNDSSGGGSGGGGTGGGGGGSGTTSLVLVNTNSQADIMTLANNGVIDLATTGNKIGIRAEIPGGTTRGVTFTLTGPFNWTQSEGSSSPWSLFGDIGVNVNPWPAGNLILGSYNLSVKANGTTTSISFSIVSDGSGGSGGGSGGGTGGGTGHSAVLVNTNTQNDISTINSGDIIDLSKVGNKIGIRAEIPGGTTRGVTFTLSGPFNWSQAESSSSPWSLFGDIGVNINPWPSANLNTGNYTLKIKANGTTITVSFQIISGTTANARDISPDFPTATFGMPQVTSVYPNPVTDNRLNVSFSKPIDGDVSYTIFDTTGKAVQLEEMDANNTVLLQLRLTETVAPGLYYLKLKSRTHQVVWHQRFIKMAD